MAQIRILNENIVRELLTLPMALQAVEQAYLQKASGQGEIWPMVFHEFDPGHVDLDIKSGHLSQTETYGLKVVSFHDGNPSKGLPILQGTSLIFDLETGVPKALLNAGAITDYRTGAAGAIGAKYLARKDSKTLLMAGCGALAPYLIAATLLVLPGLNHVLLVNPRRPGGSAERLDGIVTEVDSLLKESGAVRQAEIIPVTGLEQAVRESDVILTATPARQPYIQTEWVRPGAHLSCVGADMSGKQEIDQNIMGRARVFGDDEVQCLSVGECEAAHKKGILQKLDGELGAVINGTVPGRTNNKEITVFDSTGISLQDLATAGEVLSQAEKLKKGILVEL